MRRGGQGRDVTYDLHIFALIPLAFAKTAFAASSLSFSLGGRVIYLEIEIFTFLILMTGLLHVS